MQLNVEGDARDIASGLDDYVYQFADKASKANSLPAFAVGEQFETGGEMEQWWHVVNAGMIRGSARAIRADWRTHHFGTVAGLRDLVHVDDQAPPLRLGTASTPGEGHTPE